jgi:hypothetical protein
VYVTPGVVEAVQLRLIWVFDTAVADRFVGGAGGVPPVLVTVKITPLLASPPTVTTIGPVVAPTGTVEMKLVVVQFEVAALLPAKVTEPVTEPKFTPSTVT